MEVANGHTKLLAPGIFCDRFGKTQRKDDLGQSVDAVSNPSANKKASKGTISMLARTTVSFLAFSTPCNRMIDL